MYLDSVSDLKRSLEKEAINFEDLDKKTQAIFENELWIKEKANRYYAALEVVLLLSIITLVSQFI